MKRQTENAKVGPKAGVQTKAGSVIPVTAPGSASSASVQSTPTKAVWSNYIESRLKHFGSR